MTYFDAAQEELEAEYNARYDYISEAYAGMVETREQLEAESEDCAREAAEEEAAFIGPRQPRPVYDGDDIPF